MFPYRFVNEEHNIKFAIDIDNQKNFILDVNGQAFGSLPLRLYPIKLTDPGDVEDKKVETTLRLNDVEFESQMILEVEHFQQIINEKLDNAPITSIFIGEW